MTAEVIRIGNKSQRCKVRYRTRDSSAKAGTKYEEQEGILEFDQGESMKTLTVPILNDDSFDATLEFAIELSEVTGARMASRLSRCRVVIIDDDCFPTNRFAEEIRGMKHEEIPALPLMMEFVRMNLASKRLLCVFLKSLLIDQVKNLYFVLTMYLQIYMIDTVLAPPAPDGMMMEDEGGERRLLLRFIQFAARRLGEEEEEIEYFDPDKLIVKGKRRETGMVVGVLYIIPFFWMQIVDILKVRYEIAGIVRIKVQTNLLRKFFNYKEEMRSSISSAEVTMAMIRDIAEAVDEGFMKTLSVIAIVGKVAMLAVFVLAENSTAAIPLVVNPLIMLVYLWIREGITVRTNEAMAEKQNDIVQSMHSSVTNFRLMADFSLRPYMVEVYEAVVERFNRGEQDAAIVSTNNSYLPGWLMTMLIGGYMTLGTYLVVTCGGTLSLGTFIATINVFKECGRELSEVYAEMSEVMKATGPLRKVVYFMNLETDNEDRMLVTRRRMKLGQAMREEKRKSLLPGKSASNQVAFAVDAVDIEVSDLTFSYGKHEPVFRNTNGKFGQGKLFAIVGPPHSGKGTMLKLLGEVLLTKQDCGQIFVPPHLQILHVSRDTVLLESASFFTNLVFQMDPTAYGGTARVRSICLSLGFSEFLVERLSDEQVQDGEGRRTEDWFNSLSLTELARLQLARAFIMNPEFMVYHNPTLHFNESETKKVVRLMKEHVEQRGLAVEDEHKALRRPRTVIFTSSTAHGLSEVDEIWEVSAQRIRFLAKQEREELEKSKSKFSVVDRDVTYKEAKPMSPENVAAAGAQFQAECIPGQGCKIKC